MGSPMLIFLLMGLAHHLARQRQQQIMPLLGQQGALGAPGAGSLTQKAQGPAGMAQGPQGAQGPMSGIGALLNGAGSLPHQQPGYVSRGPGM